MKLLPLLLASTFAESELGGRAYSNWPPFLEDTKEKAQWLKNNRNIRLYNDLQPATVTYFEEFFGDKIGRKFVQNMKKLLTDVQRDFPKNVERCDKRTNREVSGGANVSFNEDSKADIYKLPLDKGVQTATSQLFLQYAKWAREEIFWNCPRIGNRIVSSIFGFNFIDTEVSICSVVAFA
jgi:hypothetical protein